MSGFEMSGQKQGSVPPPLPEHHGKPLAPVVVGERIVSMDVIRGLALLGILISNMIHFCQPLGMNGWRGDLWMSSADRFADWIAMTFIEGKFYPIFSMLFGMGFAMQMRRAADRGFDFTDVYLRRLFVLMGFGLLHGILLWEGDVLLSYGMCGLLLLLFRGRKPLTLLIWAAVFILIPALLMLMIGMVLHLFSDHPEVQSAMNDFYAGDQETMEEMYRVFLTGSYLDAVGYRLGEMIYMVFITMFFAPLYLGLFLIGMLAGQKGILSDVRKHKRLLIGIFAVCGVIGLATNYLGAWLHMTGITRLDFGQMLMGYGVNSLFGPVLAFAYIAGIALFIQRWSWAKLFSPFAAVGRMALTNYLAQSLIATTIFYGYGFGFGGTVGRMGTIGISLVIFAAQIVFSICWLRFYRYGPMEWLWRSLAYGSRQPMGMEKHL